MAKISEEKRKEIWDMYEKVERAVRDSLKGIVRNEYDITPDMLIHHTLQTEEVCDMLDDLNDIVTKSTVGF